LIYPCYAKNRYKYINFGDYVFYSLRVYEVAISTQYVSSLLYWWLWGLSLVDVASTKADYAVLAANTFPLLLTSMELIMDGIVFDKDYYYYSMSVSTAYVLMNMIYTLTTTNNYIYFWSWVNLSSYLLGGLFVGI
jgi:hypothetical protein